MHRKIPICCSALQNEERLAKAVLQGTVRGGRTRARQKKRWEDNRVNVTAEIDTDEKKLLEQIETKRNE